LQELKERNGHPELKELVGEASRALALLDADRLEELAISCLELSRDLAHGDLRVRAALALEAKDARGEMAVFAKVLEATQANLNVMIRLREFGAEQLEYGAGRLKTVPLELGNQERGARPWRRTESGHGDN
jgi:hypothetical protein